MIRIVQYRDKCIGCYACVEAAPDRWRISRKDGKSVLIGGIAKKSTFSVQVSEIELPENRQAADNCPVNIIRIC
jgi:ferredoxin